MTLYDAVNFIYTWYITKIVLRGRAGSGCKFYFPVALYNANNISIMQGVKVGPFVTIIAGAPVSIGAHSLIASNTVITSSGHMLEPRFRCKSIDKPVVIEENVWIGASCVVLPGIRIGRNSVIGAGSVVSKDIPTAKILIQKRLSCLSDVPDADL